ncbi:hypothetical protein Tco_1135650 [Tanacetum coccineum]
MDITLTLSPITSLDVQFDTPSPLPPILGHPIPWNLLKAHGDSMVCVASTIICASVCGSCKAIRLLYRDDKMDVRKAVE